MGIPQKKIVGNGIKQAKKHGFLLKKCGYLADMPWPHVHSRTFYTRDHIKYGNTGANKACSDCKYSHNH
jgi:hypothetical protein